MLDTMGPLKPSIHFATLKEYLIAYTIAPCTLEIT